MPIGNPTLRLGPRRYDLTRRCLVMGVLNRRPDLSYDQGATFTLDRMLRRAEKLMNDGADVLDVGSGLSEEEEPDRVVPAVEALVARFDVPVSVDTGSARGLAAACAAGAVVGHDNSGFADPEYLPTAAQAGASVVAAHTGLAQEEDLVADVAASLVDRAERARAAGLAPDQIMLDPGLDRGKTAAQSAVLLRESERLASLGYPLLLSASEKTVVGAPSLAAVAYGVSHGCRIVRVHDVAGTVRVVRMIERILEAGADTDGQPGA